MNCGLLGRKLGHSYSPQIHAMLGEYPYDLFEIEPEDLDNFLRNGNFTGLNVTVPYKKSVIPFCDHLSPIACRLGAVNTLIRSRDGTLTGHNTDYFGFQSMLAASGLTVSHKKCLVLGSGGASNTAVAVLEEQGADVIVISRSGEHNYKNLHQHRDASVIVNTTPLGMFPETGISPVDLDHFPQLEGVLDVIYNPAHTKLLLDAKSRGLVAVNGLLMLVAQAKEAAEWFTGQPIPQRRIPEIHWNLRTRMENLVLIGMPGSGKTSIGKILADKLDKTFVDTDQEIVRLAGKTIPEIFAQDGEDVFRDFETKVLKDLGKQSGLVIATGGGCVTKKRNEPLLRQNGTIIWLQRDLNRLPKDGRPLSQQTDLQDMYRLRQPLYDKFADVIVDNDGSLESTFDRIIGALEVMK